jgi:hypothetical protein
LGKEGRKGKERERRGGEGKGEKRIKNQEHDTKKKMKDNKS